MSDPKKEQKQQGDNNETKPAPQQQAPDKEREHQSGDRAPGPDQPRKK